MHPYHQSHFYALGAWDKYRDHLRKLVDAQHATYLNADDWIEDPNEFADHLHLTPSGAQDFSRAIGGKDSRDGFQVGHRRRPSQVE